MHDRQIKEKREKLEGITIENELGTKIKTNNFFSHKQLYAPIFFQISPLEYTMPKRLYLFLYVIVLCKIVFFSSLFHVLGGVTQKCFVEI